MGCRPTASIKTITFLQLANFHFPLAAVDVGPLFNLTCLPDGLRVGLTPLPSASSAVSSIHGRTFSSSFIPSLKTGSNCCAEATVSVFRYIPFPEFVVYCFIWTVSFVCVYVCVYVCEYRSIGSTDVSRFELYKHPLHNIGATVFVCALNKGIKNCEMPSLRFHGVVFGLAIMASTLLGWFYD